MQTRRDQLQAYRFQNRRALAALVTGQPNVLEPPMRRLTVTTLAGIMIAILIAIVFGILAIIRPSAGTAWQHSDAVVVDQDNNATYIYTEGTLHPASNYTSAVLAASGGTSGVKRVEVSSGDIAGATFGFEIGIVDAPTALPPASSLLRYPISVCSVQHARGTVGANTVVTLHIGSEGATTPVPRDQGVLVGRASDARTGAQSEWLLLDGRRLPVTPQVAAALGYSAAPVSVGTAFLNTVPQGPALAVPQITGQGTTQATFTLDGRRPAIGTIVRTTDPSGAYLVLATGMVSASPLEVDIFAASGAKTVQTSHDQVNAHLLANLNPAQNPLTALAGLPTTPPAIDATAAQREGVCAVYHAASKDPRLLLPARALPSDYVPGPTFDSSTSQHGMADKVEEPAVAAMLAMPLHADGTIIVISGGTKYSFANSGLLSAFGYSRSDVVTVPPQLLTLMARGTGLSKSAALARVTH